MQAVVTHPEGPVSIGDVNAVVEDTQIITERKLQWRGQPACQKFA